MCIFFCNFVPLTCAYAYIWRVRARITRALSARTMLMHVRNARVGGVVPVGVNVCVKYKLYEI